jgi:hypothetical protein
LQLKKIPDENEVLKGVGAPTTPPTDPTENKTYFDTTTNQITHYWNAATAAWVPIVGSFPIIKLCDGTNATPTTKFATPAATGAYNTGYVAGQLPGGCSTLLDIYWDNANKAITVGKAGSSNAASAQYGTVSGGASNVAAGQWDTIAGGVGNATANTASTISGGYLNQSGGAYATVGGGASNIAMGSYATVSGGSGNAVNGNYSAVYGGVGNNVSGVYSGAAGISNVVSGVGSFAYGNAVNIAGNYSLGYGLSNTF